MLVEIQRLAADRGLILSIQPTSWTPINRETEALMTFQPEKFFMPKHLVNSQMFFLPARARGQFGYMFPEGKDHHGPQAAQLKAERRQLTRAKRQVAKRPEGDRVRQEALSRIAKLKTNALLERDKLWKTVPEIGFG